MRLDRRDWLWVELTVALVGRAQKTLIHLTVDGCGWVSFLLVVWPEATQHWTLPGLFGEPNDRLWEGSCQGVLPRTSAASVLVLMMKLSHSLPLQEILQH